MRTTVSVADHLLTQARQLAASRRTSLARIVEESLRRYLAEERARGAATSAPRPLPVVRRARLRPGVNLDDTSALLDLE